jgi:hypothetical protein
MVVYQKWVRELGIWGENEIQDVIVGHSEAISGGLLSQHRFSDNVGGVKQLSSTLQHALVEERHFALDEIAVPTKARS